MLGLVAKSMEKGERGDAQARSSSRRNALKDLSQRVQRLEGQCSELQVRASLYISTGAAGCEHACGWGSLSGVHVGATGVLADCSAQHRSQWFAVSPHGTGILVQASLPTGPSHLVPPH